MEVVILQGLVTKNEKGRHCESEPKESQPQLLMEGTEESPEATNIPPRKFNEQLVSGNKSSSTIFTQKSLLCNIENSRKVNHLSPLRRSEQTNNSNLHLTSPHHTNLNKRLL